MMMARGLWLMSLVSVVLAGTSVSNVSGAVNEFERRMVDVLNELRRQGFQCPYGRYFPPNNVPLVWECRLAAAAKKWSQRMAAEGFIGHTKPGDPSTASTRTQQEGYPCAGAEILAGGQDTPEKALDGYKESDAHCVVMMDPAFTQAGAGYASNPSHTYRYLSTVNFGSYWKQPDQSCIGGSAGGRPKPGCANTDCSNCEYYKNQGYCSTSPNVQQACKDTCQQGACADGPAPAPGCTDDDSNCGLYGSLGYCNLPHIQTACKQTCGTCGGGGACADTDGQCEYYRSLGYCSTLPHIRDEYCRKTCGTCAALDSQPAPLNDTTVLV
jgi:uncharacterized protein YkwD